ncbi:MAG: hypothetical protein GXO91_06030 [FCB group bacterium]|nr:hypothetical protein [FCB group bacterium]
MIKHIKILLCCFISAGFLSAAVTLGQLSENATVGDFTTEAVYETVEGQVQGARFRHVPSGFVLDFMRIQSIPQAFFWVNSHPVSDQGEPHTLEHLVLGKGNKGRYVGSLEEMRLGSSSAFTQQLRTCYHFNTSATSDVFFELFEAKLDALLHPDFSDEEIRREVMNVGVAEDPVDGSLKLEEKGTVYNEMVSSFEKPWGNLYSEMGRMLFGETNPSGFSAGGIPAAIRTMQPEDIRTFHASNYHLNNMGAVVTLPDDVGLEEFLERMSRILNTVEPDAVSGNDPDDGPEALPAYAPAPAGTLRQVHFPGDNPDEPGDLVFAWPAELNPTAEEALLLDIFIANLAGGETSNLYSRFIASGTRTMDIGATSVSGWRSDEKGNPVYISFRNIATQSAAPEAMEKIRSAIQDEIRTIASLPSNSPELQAFNDRALNRILQQRRSLRDFLNSPPRFGYRGTGSRWMNHLHELHRQGGFHRDLLMGATFDAVEDLLRSGENRWGELIEKWQLLKVQPFGVSTLPDPDYLITSEKARDERLMEYLGDLKKRYGIEDDLKVITAFKKDYDAKTAVIEAAAADVAMPEFVKTPPLTLDDQLDYTVETLPGGGNLVFSDFENISGGTIGFAFDLHRVPPPMLTYLAALPTLMTEIGVTKDGTVLSFEEMKEAQRQDILKLSAYFSANGNTGRVELTVSGSGSDLAETLKVIDWLKAILFSPDLSPMNLPRIRDAIANRLGALRNRMQGPEESWVHNPANAFKYQDDLLYLTTNSFLTQTHALQRLKWKLKEPPASAGLVVDFFSQLSDLAQFKSGADLRDILGSLRTEPMTGDIFQQGQIGFILPRLDAASLTTVRDILGDLQLTLAEIPGESLKTDWPYLCNAALSDLQLSPVKVLIIYRDLLKKTVNINSVRAWVICSKSNMEKIRPELNLLTEDFFPVKLPEQTYRTEPRITNRMLLRERALQTPVYVGLVNENTRAGVHINSASGTSVTELDQDHLLDFLASKLYGGHGAHSMFMKTWAAGLAYSNGVGSSEISGQVSYYAERCPDLAQTMQFVVNELERAPDDPALADYAVAQAFKRVRSGDRYDSRGRAMADDLADDLTPAVVRAFREKILALGDAPDLYEMLKKRMPEVYGRVLPGLGPKGSAVKGALYFVIGPETQLDPYETYLKSIDEKAVLYRVYPRDYWIVN